MPRGTPYNRYSAADRERVCRVADEGGDWRQLAEQLGVAYHTAYTWVRSGRNSSMTKGGTSKILSEEQIDLLLVEVEKDPSLTLNQLVEKAQELLEVRLSKSTIHNYLEGRLITLKKVHHVPCTINSLRNKSLRREYVEKLTAYMRDGKTIIWMDETNLNLFCRRTQGRARAGERAVVALPTSKGPNVHIIGAISAYQKIYMTRR